MENNDEIKMMETVEMAMETEFEAVTPGPTPLKNLKCRWILRSSDSEETEPETADTPVLLKQLRTRQISAQQNDRAIYSAHSKINESSPWKIKCSQNHQDHRA